MLLLPVMIILIFMEKVIKEKKSQRATETFETAPVDATEGSK